MSGDIQAAADIVTGAAVAHAVAPSGGHGEAVHGICLNCGTRLIGPFCSECGQTAHLHRTLVAIGHDLLHGVFHFEGRTWHTIPMLAWRPGELTRQYVHGKRARFNSPLAMFLFSVFLMFAVFHAVSPFTSREEKPVAKVNANGADLDKQISKVDAQVAFLEGQRNRSLANGETVAAINKQLADAQHQASALHAVSGFTDAAAAVDGGHGFSIHSGLPWLDSILQRASKNPDLLIYKLQTEAYKYSWLLIPISLPFIWIMFFWWRDVTVYDHAIFAIHSLTFMTLLAVTISLLAAIGVGSAWLACAALLIPPIHIFRHLKGAYCLTRLGALWRTAWMLNSAFVASMLFLGAILSMGLGD